MPTVMVSSRSLSVFPIIPTSLAFISYPTGHQVGLFSVAVCSIQMHSEIMRTRSMPGGMPLPQTEISLSMVVPWPGEIPAPNC